MICTIGGIKGGSGKTTIATNLTVYLVTQGRDVILVDADDQESATDFSSFRFQSLNGELGYTAVKITGSELNANVTQLAKKYDDVIIDTGGRDTVSQRSALSISHVYLVPFALITPVTSFRISLTSKFLLSARYPPKTALLNFGYNPLVDKSTI